MRDVALGLAPVYEALQRGVSTTRGRRAFVDEYLRPEHGDRVLEIGCGTANLLGRLREVDYVGFDPSPEYIEAARATHGDRGSFFVAGIDDVSAEALGQFDLVVCKGVLHHLDDRQVGLVGALAAATLAPDGRFVSLDPARSPAQHPVARWLVSSDRGGFVRRVGDYEALIGHDLEVVLAVERHDLLRVPYTHAVLVAHRREPPGPCSGP